MKVLISTAIWGESYCSIFTRLSLATLLSRENIPKLATRAAVTFHICTRRVDRHRLLHDPAVVELQRYCAIEWELIEDFGVLNPPEGPSGEKYPFLSALQNIAIARSVDHDAIVFNYADFIWADGSLTHALDLLMGGREPLDAIFAFCLPVDRDLAMVALEKYRQTNGPEVVQLAPRDGARIAIECIHREAKLRLWEESPRFTNLPSYLIWRVGNHGLLIRAYHQSILAMRVRPDDPQYVRGILRGSLDSSFAAQLAKSDSIAFATDTDKVLVFSLYDTPVDSRLPPHVTRESSLANVLRSEVTLDQRRLAARPFLLRLRDGDETLWSKVADTSWNLLRQAHASVAFDPPSYQQNYETHGIVPEMARRSFLYRHVLRHFKILIHRIWTTSEFQKMQNTTRRAIGQIQRKVHVLRQPPLLRAALKQGVARVSLLRRGQQILFALRHPPVLRAALARRLIRMPLLSRLPSLHRAATPSLPANEAANRDLDALLAAGDADAVEAAFLPRAWSFTVVPNIAIEPIDNARYMAAIFVEDSTSRVIDYLCLMSALRTAEQLLRRAMTSAPVWIDPVRALGRNLWFQGRFEEAIRTYAAAEELRDEMARAAGLPINSCLYLPRNCVESIGLMGHIDAFIKYKILTNDQRPYYLLAPPQNIVNDAFLDYWKEYITVVSKQAEIAGLAPLEPVYSVNWNWVLPKDGKIVFVHEGMAAIQRAWQRSGRLPLLHLREDHAAALREVHTKWGMKEGERFICLHVRSIGFYGEKREMAQRFRNTTIESYYPLIRAIVDMGFWVIRMGDGSMPPLDLAQCGGSRVVDYAVSPERTAVLDVALCAQCELFVSSPSGLHTVAHAFGRPVCEVNYPIYPGFPWHPDDIFVPQLYFSHTKGRALTLQEILGSDVVHRDHQFLLEPAGITLVPNEPDDMIETVREALSPSTYRVASPEFADEVCATFDALNQKYHRGISGRIGRYFAMKYASQLLSRSTDERTRTQFPARMPTQNLPPPLEDSAKTTKRPPKRKLDVLIPTFNRPKRLHHLVKTGLALGVPGMCFVVIDDASTTFDDIPGLGLATTEMVCRSFDDERVIYTCNPTNMGVAASLVRYYRELCDAEYTSLFTDKDEFINAGPFIRGLAKLDADPKITLVMLPLRQIDRYETDRPLLFNYNRMSGKEFLAIYVHDTMLQHAGAYAIVRVAAARRAGIPRTLDLRAYGLEDASGIDIDNLFMLATTGDIEFESEAPIRRSVVEGYTERYPLTFAYCYYQYAKRLMAELKERDFMSGRNRRSYLAWWHLLIARGLVVAYRHVHGSELEQGVKRIRPHLPMPILLYLPVECLRFGVVPRAETIQTYFRGAHLLLNDWWNKINGRPHIA